MGAALSARPDSAELRERLRRSLRLRLDNAFRATVDSELARPGMHAPPRGWPLRLPPALRESIVAAARLAGGALPPGVESFYTEKMPRMLVEQLFGPRDPARELPWRPLDLRRLPKLREALEGAFAALAGAGLEARALLGAESPEALVAARPTLAELVAPTLQGSGLPLLGVYPAERAVIAADLGRGEDPDAVIDRRLSGNAVHDLCHGLQVETDAPPGSWMLLEAAALHLGACARPAHVFPDEPGEAIPGVSLFVLVGDACARRFGRAPFWKLLLGAPAAEALGARPAAAAEAASGQEFLRRLAPPFVQDALRAMDWVKLLEAARGPAPRALATLVERAAQGEDLRELPDLLDAAAAVRWRDLPWWGEEPVEADDAMVEIAVRALFQVNVLAPSFQTHPAEVPGGVLRLEVERCALAADPRADGFFGEPAHWLFPPPLARRLFQRGARWLTVRGASRARAGEIARGLVDLSHGGGALAEGSELDFEARVAAGP